MELLIMFNQDDAAVGIDKHLAWSAGCELYTEPNLSAWCTRHYHVTTSEAKDSRELDKGVCWLHIMAGCQSMVE
jgi:hypothetical protein